MNSSATQPQSGAYQGKLIFMTDPICSWCWGTLPEVDLLRERFSHQLQFELKCAGLQIGSQRPLTDAKRQELIDLWQQVSATTGQTFAFTLPEDRSFIYHSELACRTLQIARGYLRREPWDVFEAIQKAFYVNSRNIADLDTLYTFMEPYGMSYEDFATMLIQDDIVSMTRNEFDWCGERGIQALPTIFLDQGSGPELVCGGYATAEYLIPDIITRLPSH